MIFQSLMGLKNQGVTIFSGTAQGNSYPSTFFFTFIIPYSLYTNDDDNNGNRPPTLNITSEFSNRIHVEKHGN
jgi:hypothetical protein